VDLDASGIPGHGRLAVLSIDEYRNR